MIITLESTPTISIVNDQPRRLWRGKTAGGTPIVALVSAIGVSETADPAELGAFESELIDSTKQILAQGEIVALPLEMAAGALLEGGLRSRLASIIEAAFAVQSDAPMDALLDTLEAELDRQALQIDCLRAALDMSDSRLDPSREKRRRTAVDACAGEPVARSPEPRPSGSAPAPPWVVEALGNFVALAHRACVELAIEPPEPPIGADEIDSEPASNPPLVASIVRAILDDERVTAPDRDAAARFVANALRGAQMAWHVRHAHGAADIATVRRLGAPGDETSAAWLHGYDTAIAATEPGRALEVES